MRPGRHAAAMDQEPLAVWLFVELAMSSERGQVHHPPLVCSVTTGLLHLQQTLFLCTSLLVVGGWLPSCNPTPPPDPSMEPSGHFAMVATPSKVGLVVVCPADDDNSIHQNLYPHCRHTYSVCLLQTIQ